MILVLGYVVLAAVGLRILLGSILSLSHFILILILLFSLISSAKPPFFDLLAFWGLIYGFCWIGYYLRFDFNGYCVFGNSIGNRWQKRWGSCWLGIWINISARLWRCNRIWSYNGFWRPNRFHRFGSRWCNLMKKQRIDSEFYCWFGLCIDIVFSANRLWWDNCMRWLIRSDKKMDLAAWKKLAKVFGYNNIPTLIMDMGSFNLDNITSNLDNGDNGGYVNLDLSERILDGMVTLDKLEFLKGSNGSFIPVRVYYNFGQTNGVFNTVNFCFFRIKDRIIPLLVYFPKHFLGRQFCYLGVCPS